MTLSNLQYEVILSSTLLQFCKVQSSEFSGFNLAKFSGFGTKRKIMQVSFSCCAISWMGKLKASGRALDQLAVATASMLPSAAVRIAT